MSFPFLTREGHICSSSPVRVNTIFPGLFWQSCFMDLMFYDHEKANYMVKKAYHIAKKHITWSYGKPLHTTWHIPNTTNHEISLQIKCCGRTFYYCVLGGWCQGCEFDSPCGRNSFQSHLFSKIICVLTCTLRSQLCLSSTLTQRVICMVMLLYIGLYTVWIFLIPIPIP